MVSKHASDYEYLKGNGKCPFNYLVSLLNSNFYHHNQQALVNMALGNQSMGMGPGPSTGRHMSHMQAGALADAYTAQNGLYGLQGGPALHAAPLHAGLQSHSIDSYVMQGSNNHSPGLTPPHTQAGSFSGVSSYGNAFPVGVADPYQRQSFAYGM